MEYYSDITQDEFLLRHFEILDGKDNSDFLRSETFNCFLQTNGLIEYWGMSVNYIVENYAFLAELKFLSIISQHDFAKLSSVLEFLEKK